MKKTFKNLIHPWQKKPVIEKHIYQQKKPIWTMVMPIFNQEKKIKKILRKIYEMAYYPFEIILINDGSSDDSLDRIKKICSSLNKKTHKIVASTIIQNELPIFETACDNQGFKLAKANFIIEIQADIYIDEKDFDRKMIFAMQQLNLASISGRQLHNFSMLDKQGGWLKYPWKIMLWRILKIGQESYGAVSKKMFQKNKSESGICYVGETNSRGPWLVKKSDLKKYNYLDEKKFFLGNDDHDFNRRVFKNEARLAGYVPMEVYSIANDGSTRKERQGINKKIYEYLKLNKKGSKQFNNFIMEYKPYSKIKRELIKK